MLLVSTLCPSQLVGMAFDKEIEFIFLSKIGTKRHSSVLLAKAHARFKNYACIWQANRRYSEV
jgi:hypothetical protein